MRKAVILLFLLCICLSSGGQSGELSSYERERYDIANTALKKVTEPMTAEQQLLIAMVYTKMNKVVEDIFDATTVMENIIFKYCGGDGDLLTDANLLPQFQYPEKNLIGNYRNVWREVAKWYRSERLRIDAARTELDREREIARNNYKKGKGEIINRLSDSFVSWAMHRDGEDDATYNARIEASAADVFDSLAYMLCNRAWKDVMVIGKGRYDANAGELTLDYYNIREKESRPLHGRYVTDIFDARKFDVDDIIPDESYAAGLFFRDGLCYPSTLFLCRKGMTEDIRLELAPDEHVTISGESVKIEGTRNFIETVTPYIREHVFDYSEYAAGRIYRNALYSEMYALYSGLIEVFGADGGIRIEQFMPQGEHFSRVTADRVLSAFRDYCLAVAPRGLYGPYIDRCTGMISLDGMCDLFSGDVSALRAAADRAIDEYIVSLAVRVKDYQANAAIPGGSLSDALALIFGIHSSGSDLDADAKAGLLVENCNPLRTMFMSAGKALRKGDSPYINFLLNQYPAYVIK